MPDKEEKSAPNLKADGFRTVYSNGTVMGISPWDVQITFSQSSGIGDGRKVLDEVTIIQSPVHAKAMLKSLAKTIAIYEQGFGVIYEPEKDGSKIKAPEAKPAKKAT